MSLDAARMSARATRLPAESQDHVIFVDIGGADFESVGLSAEISKPKLRYS